MSKKHKTTEEEQVPEVPYTKKTYFYVAIGSTAVSVVFAVLGFTVSVINIYGIIVAILMSLAALSFLATQKKKNNFKAVKPLTIINYVILILLILFIIGGIIWAATQTEA
ncbi:MAG: hypothetical protein LUD50_03475 [Clostridia bacterium]|nr:hypothetical protein [Clostridia bacterium]